MKVGICVTKHKPSSAIYHAIYHGILACGDIPTIIQQEKFMPNCDVLIGIGEVNDGRDKLRNKIISYYKKEGIRRIAIDTGFILLNDFNAEREAKRKQVVAVRKTQATFDPIREYFSFGFDGTKSFGSYYNKNSPLDRLQKLGIEIQPWVTEGNEILVLGINKNGFCASFINYKGWQLDTLQYLTKKYESSRIFYRLHRGESNFDPIVDTFGVKQSRSYQRSLSDDFKRKFVTVTTTSNCTVASLIAGIPPICTHPLNVLYPYVTNRVQDVHRLKKPVNREQILADLAYAQWNLSEISTGEAWGHLRPHILEPPTYNLNYMEMAKNA